MNPGRCQQLAGRLDNTEASKNVGSTRALAMLIGRVLPCRLDRLGWTQVDVHVFWENVNSILRECTCIFVPNLRSTSFIPMYTDVLSWRIMPHLAAKTSANFAPTIDDLFLGDAAPNYCSLVDRRWRDLSHCRSADSG